MWPHFWFSKAGELDIDERSVAFLRSGGVLAIRHNHIWALNPAWCTVDGHRQGRPRK